MIGKQYDKEDRISVDIICPLINYILYVDLKEAKGCISHSYKWKTQPRESTETTIHQYICIKRAIKNNKLLINKQIHS